MNNTAIIWTFAAVLAAASFAGGLKMRDEKRMLPFFAWYAAGAFFLFGGALLWVSMEIEMRWQHRVVLGVVGALLGAFAALSLGELLHGPPASVLTAQEQAHRASVLSQLRQEYIRGHDGLSPALLAGTEDPPADWVNRRLRELGENWQMAQAKKPSE